VGDPIDIEVDVSHPAGYRVRMAKPAAQLADFTLLDFAAVTQKPGASATHAPEPVEHDRIRLTVAVYKTGAFTFPPVPLTIVGADGREFAAATNPVGITIQSVLGEKDDNLKDLKRQAEIEEPFPWRMWAAAGGALLTFALLAWWLLRRRRPPILPAPAGRPDLGPLEIAEVELRDLAARGLPEKGLIKPFYVSLSDILRKILEGGFAVTTAEKTTTEIIEALQQSATPPPDSARLASIESLLGECDLVKFARFLPPREEAMVALKSAIELLEFCKGLRAAPAPDPAVEAR
jgi:hypothetical protein